MTPEFADADLTDDKFLMGRLRLLQPARGYRAATDPVLLAAACPAVAGESVLDLGCGVGAAALCLGARVPGVVLAGTGGAGMAAAGVVSDVSIEGLAILGFVEGIKALKLVEARAEEVAEAAV